MEQPSGHTGCTLVSLPWVASGWEKAEQRCPLRTITSQKCYAASGRWACWEQNQWCLAAAAAAAAAAVAVAAVVAWVAAAAAFVVVGQLHSSVEGLGAKGKKLA